MRRYTKLDPWQNGRAWKLCISASPRTAWAFHPARVNHEALTNEMDRLMKFPRVLSPAWQSRCGDLVYQFAPLEPLSYPDHRGSWASVGASGDPTNHISRPVGS